MTPLEIILKDKYSHELQLGVSCIYYIQHMYTYIHIILCSQMIMLQKLLEKSILRNFRITTESVPAVHAAIAKALD